MRQPAFGAAATSATLVIAAACIAAPTSSAAGSAAGVRVKTSVTPRATSFGDSITARVDVVVDRRRVDPRSVRINPSFGSWTQAGAPRASSGAVGSLFIHSWRFTLTCLDVVCLPGKEPLVVQLPQMPVTARSVDGSTLIVRAGWPAFSVAGRTSPAKGSATPFEQETTLPAATYRLSPTLLALALDIVAGLLVAFACSLVAVAIVRRQEGRGRTVDKRSPLVRALAFVREAQGRRADDRRRAVGLLARTLGRDEDRLAGVASRVAWSAEEPSPDKLEELARTVEAEVERSK
jgi:hypothetical protein